MLDFKTVHGTQETTPPSYEKVGNKVFVRKDIKSISVESESGNIEMWEYLEAYCTESEYAEYLASLNAIDLTDLEIRVLELEMK